MANTNYVMRASCDCGSCIIESTTHPKARLRCHCTICQSFTGVAFSDVALLPGYRATFTNPNLIQYKMYKTFRFPPPNLRRGRCMKCGKALIETWGFGPLKMLFIRAVCIEKQELLPLPEADIFYEHHLIEFNDQVPKYTGYLQSQYAIAKIISHAF